MGKTINSITAEKNEKDENQGKTAITTMKIFKLHYKKGESPHSNYSEPYFQNKHHVP